GGHRICQNSYPTPTVLQPEAINRSLGSLLKKTAKKWCAISPKMSCLPEHADRPFSALYHSLVLGVRWIGRRLPRRLIESAMRADRHQPWSYGKRSVPRSPEAQS